MGDDELEQAIAENAQGPKQAQVDGQVVTQHSILDQIAADRYLAAKKAARSKSKGLRISKLVPPGAA